MLQAATQGVQLAHEVSSLFKGGSRGGNRNKGNEIVDVSFVTQVTLAAGIGEISLGDATLLSQDLTTLGTIYRYYRFRHVELEFPAPIWTTASQVAVMFADSAYAQVPTFANSEAKHMVLLSSEQTVPTTLRVPGKDMQGQVPWFLTQGDASDPSLDFQGKILFGASVSSAETLVFLIRCRVEFKTILDPTVMAARSLARTQKFNPIPKELSWSDPPDREKITEEEERLLARIRAARASSS